MGVYGGAATLVFSLLAHFLHSTSSHQHYIAYKTHKKPYLLANLAHTKSVYWRIRVVHPTNSFLCPGFYIS